MINNVEKNQSINAMSDLEHDKNKVEMMRYRPNGLSYKLGLMALLFSVLGAFISLNSMNPNNWMVIAKIMLNIIILLGGFLCVEKTKAYSKGASIGLVVGGGLCVARIFWIPLIIFANYTPWVSASKKLDELKTAGAVDTEITAQKAVVDGYAKYLGRTITASKEDMLVNWLPQNGNLRAVLAIIFLVCAAGLFITAGVIGFIQAKKLETYLNSLKETK